MRCFIHWSKESEFIYKKNETKKEKNKRYDLSITLGLKVERIVEIAFVTVESSNISNGDISLYYELIFQ